MDVPPTLRLWFLVHAAVDVAIALPLLIAPEVVLHQLGWMAVDPIATRVAAAALLAIGGQSFLARDAGVAVYRSMLNLKMIWSITGAVGLLVGIGAGAPSAAWAFLCMFIVFSGVWIHHAIRFRQHDRGPADDAATLVDETSEADSPEGAPENPGEPASLND